MSVPKPVLPRGESQPQGEGRVLTALGGKTAVRQSPVAAQPRTTLVNLFGDVHKPCRILVNLCRRVLSVLAAPHNDPWHAQKVLLH